MFNDTAEFFCYAIGYPYLEIQWSLGKSKSGEDMIDQKNKLKLCEKNSTFIWQVTRSVDVTCEACLAHDKDDCSMEIFKISLVDVPDDFGIIKTKNITTAGDSFEASCLASIHTYKDANWYYQNGTKIVSNNNIIIENGTTISSHHSDLKIKSVPNIKTLMYACKAEKKKDNKIDTMDMNVTIYDQLAPLFVHTNMYNKTVEYDPSTDGSIVLDCHVRGYPVPSITWFINDTEILLTNNTSWIMIQHTKLSDEKSKRKQLIFAATSQLVNSELPKIKETLTITDQIKCLPYDKRFEFSSDNLVLGKQLGSGAFGVVRRAEANGIVKKGTKTTVAVKMVKQTSDPSHLTALSNELTIMIHLRKHVNIVNLLGACTKNISNGILYVIMEFCRYGNLHEHIILNRTTFVNQIDDNGNINRSLGKKSNHDAEESNSPSCNNAVRTYRKADDKNKKLQPICTDDLILWGFQVARGMEFLSQRKVLHADLAARNLLLSDGNVVKICDFGLAKNIDAGGIYQKTNGTCLPVKWMAPESISELIFSTQSDVWSFGIVLWEFFTLGWTPYFNMDLQTQCEEIKKEKRLKQPKFSTEKIYELMKRCWNRKPQKRPTFSQLIEELSKLMEKKTVDLHINLNDRFLEMNRTFESGRKDYLSLMSAPDYNVVSSMGSDLTSDGTNDSDKKTTELTPMLSQRQKEQLFWTRNPNYVGAAPRINGRQGCQTV
ncbi:vascular endothelial growth factor receptor 1-like [Aphidius gifuensis]|uniref:vascular endothelial growth factor receptor 1-like n=1 Tax=Aphidius gifuensis TaxID=684658 RepID=UPI001CDBD95B|nr:vascular endothelial growth factor receptor 1-like [Aphidius gifuensis]